MQLTCHVSKGDMPLQISWNFHDELSSHMGVSATKIDVHTIFLVIATAIAGCSGNYTCMARNLAGCVSTQLYFMSVVYSERDTVTDFKLSHNFIIDVETAFR
jgi:hypothetical protein